MRVYFDPAEIGEDGYPHAWHSRWSPDGIAPTNDIAIKDLVRERDGHRCLRCGHPYRKGEMGDGHWTPCDERCTHAGPQRFQQRFYRGGTEVDPGEWCYAPSVVWLEGPVSNWFPEGLPPAWNCESEWRILTVHHLNGIKHDCRWWNLVSLCQRCHLTIQGKVYMERPWVKSHSEWFRPFVAGFYAWKYLDLELTQEETMERIDELLDLELTQEALW